jgi:hypothetical protein
VIKVIVSILIMSNLLFASIAMVKTMTGIVEVKRNKQTIFLSVGSTLQEGDIIITKAKSSIGIIFDDGTRIALGEKAIFVIKVFKVNPNKKEYNIDLKLKKGKAVFSSGKIGKLSPESVKFHIPEGVIGIRGTQFAVEVK